MITEYHRPETLDQALLLLNRKNPPTIPLAGGTIISRFTEKPVAVVDLQSLKLNEIAFQQNICKIGAMSRLQDIVNNLDIPAGLRKAAQREANINVRRAATIGGVLVSSDGSSPVLGCLLALNGKVIWEPDNKSQLLSDWIASDRKSSPGKLIVGIEFDVPEENKFEDIARSPEDKPQVFVTSAQWGSGDLRIVFGGNGKFPILGFDKSQNFAGEILKQDSISQDLSEKGYSEYQQLSIRTLINRQVPQTGIFGGKGQK